MPLAPPHKVSPVALVGFPGREGFGLVAVIARLGKNRPEGSCLPGGYYGRQVFCHKASLPQKSRVATGNIPFPVVRNAHFPGYGDRTSPLRVRWSLAGPQLLFRPESQEKQPCMARHPEWFERLDAVEETLRSPAVTTDLLGRQEIGAVFGVSDRDSIRLLHKFGAQPHGDALALDRHELLLQLEAVRSGSAYQAFLRQRQQVAQHLSAARQEAAARRFRVRPALADSERVRADDLPKTLTWRRTAPGGPQRFEILYDDGADLLWHLAEFLAFAGQNREEFLRATEPAEPS